jgi:hypothetical protein
VPALGAPERLGLTTLTPDRVKRLPSSTSISGASSSMADERTFRALSVRTVARIPWLYRRLCRDLLAELRLYLRGISHGPVFDHLTFSEA